MQVFDWRVKRERMLGEKRGVRGGLLLGVSPGAILLSLYFLPSLQFLLLPLAFSLSLPPHSIHFFHVFCLLLLGVLSFKIFLWSRFLFPFLLLSTPHFWLISLSCIFFFLSSPLLSSHLYSPIFSALPLISVGERELERERGKKTGISQLGGEQIRMQCTFYCKLCSAWNMLP